MVNVFRSEKGKELVLKSYDELLKRWGVDIEEIDLTTKWGVTHCILAGNKENPPLLMFHGVGDNSAVMWLLNIRELSRHFFCIAVDTLGGPGKSVPNENFNRKSFRQRDWINEMVQLLGIRDFNMIGVSNGAVMAYNYTTKEPAKISKVVCMEGGMMTGSPMKAMISTLMMAFPELLFPTRKNLVRIMKKLSSPDSDTFERHPEVVDHMVLVMKYHNQQAMFAHDLEMYDREKGIAVKDKLYFLFGDHRVERAKQYLAVLDDGGFRYKVIRNAGHGINHDQPDAVHREILRFLSGRVCEV